MNEQNFNIFNIKKRKVITNYEIIEPDISMFIVLYIEFIASISC